MKIDVADLIGIEYKEHGRDARGYDCYGLVIEVLRRAGKTLPDIFYDPRHDYSISDINAPLLPLERIERAEEFCIVEMRYRNELHIGVYLENNIFIHSTRGQGVRLSRLGIIPVHCFWRVKS